jgi:hypothetical protein
MFSEGFDAGYAHAVDRLANGVSTRMAPPEYFWNYDFRFDLRDATRGEQEAVRTVFLAQRLELDGFTPEHVACVELVMGRPAIARQAPGYSVA